MILFGFSILSAGRSRFAKLFSPMVDLVDETYQDGDSEYALRIHQPKRIQKPLPAVILYHGATPHGEKHETMNMLAVNLARMGMRVYLPELPLLKQALVREETIPRMKLVYSLITSRKEVRKDRILLAGVSFAGGLALKAGADPEINPTAIMCYGSYYDLESALRYFLTGRARFGEITVNVRPHDYARAVLFWNYLDQMELDLDMHRLRECMYLFITDEHDKAWALAGSFGEGEQSFANMAFDPDDESGMHVAEQILPKIRNQLQSISPKYFIDQIASPVFLVHGIQDIMIPYTETLALAKDFELAKKEHYVYISRIYGHATPEKRSTREFLGEMRDLVTFLNRLFKYLL